jgi:molybdopterin-guanine dinucleotide biosynthesis protein A
MNKMNIPKSLTIAVDLGLISPDQVQPMLAQYNEDQIQAILEEMISAQMHSGVQCVGNECSI